MREHSTGVSQERHASSVSGAVEQGACCSARCGCLDAAGLSTCPRRLFLGRFVLAPLRESPSLFRHPIRGYARVREAALNAPPLHSLRSCGASAAAVRLVVRRVSAIARPGAPGRTDCKHLSERLGVCTQGAFPWAYSHLHIGVRIFTQLGGCDPNIYPARRAAQACAAAPPSLLDALRCREWEVCICEPL